MSGKTVSRSAVRPFGYPVVFLSIRTVVSPLPRRKGISKYR
ncbi:MULTISPECIES: hypothetical protein [Bacteroides]|nr:hypothetical protein [Bacteroides faecis]KDS64721.1 hypothetical protein M096_0111 [Parabacteroides distasonis str. 3999B T(B) 6]KDS74942.1 hypothetical protein M095_0119 [Parabacteroides distasonis str. 3999B T(B) 4]